jgi:putative two-component system response regulator
MSEHLFAKHKFPANSARSLHGPVVLPAAAGSLQGQRGRRVLVVDACESHRSELRTLLDPGYEIVEASTSGEALLVLSDLAIDLVLVDFRTPEPGGPGFCSILRSYHRTRSISVVLIADANDGAHEAAGITAGADDFLLRPLGGLVLSARVQSVMRRRGLLESADELESVLLSLAQAVEARDPATGRHCHRVSLLCSTLGASLGLSSDELVTLQRGAFLHDIGKIAIPDRILFKRGPLSPEEWSVMKDHTTCGERICSGMKMLADVLPIIRSHHERWDGSGYPDGLRRNEIPLAARIVQVADIYDALTTDRPYKPAFSSDYAINVLREEAKTGWRDARIVDAFCEAVPLFHDAEVGSNSSLLALSSALEKNGVGVAPGGAPVLAASKDQLKEAV